MTIYRIFRNFIAFDYIGIFGSMLIT